MEDNKTNLTKEQAIQAMREGKKVRHRYFSDNEWMTMSEGKILLEDGVRVGWLEFWSDRTSVAWDIDYSIVSENKSEDNKTKEEILRDKGVQFPASRSPRDYNLVLIAMDEFSQQSTKHLQDRVKELEAVLTALLNANPNAGDWNYTAAWAKGRSLLNTKS